MKEVTMGADLSITSTGYCIMIDGEIITYGVIETQLESGKTKKKGVYASDDKFVRMKYIANELLAIIKEHKVTEVSIESPAFAAKGSASADLPALHGTVFYMLLKLAGIPRGRIEYVPPQSLKKTAADRSGVEVRRNRKRKTGVDGKSRLTGNVKDDMVTAIKSYLGDEEFADQFAKTRGKYDVTDAAWLAIRKSKEG